ncbi:MAG TPA: hypothetical protein VFM93_09870 [Candidatus Limnocylindria bacterium]|nr:hypothetical protein [Candidatus Limnocylindria bacterium]
MQPAPTLRPLGIGDIVDAVITLVRARPLLFVVIAALPQLLFSILARAFGFASAPSIDRLSERIRTGTLPDDQPFALTRADVAEVTTVLLVGGLVAVVIFTIQAGALVHASARRYLGEEVAIADAFRAALGAAPRLIAAGILASVGVVVIFLAAVLAFFALAFVGASVAGVVGALLSLVAIFAAIAVAFYLSASWLVAPVVVMREDAGPIAALRRSWWLASGSRWRILGLLMLLLVLQVVLGMLFSLLFLAAFVSDSTMGTVLEEAANLAAAAVAGPLQWGAFTLLYYDLRVRREAYDLRLAAEALPRGG